MAKSKKEYVAEDVEVTTEEELIQLAEETPVNPEIVLTLPHIDTIRDLRFQDSNGQIYQIDAGMVRGEYTLRPVRE